MAKKPNILFLVLDTQQARRMSMYGYEKNTTPVLDEFVSGGTIFDRAIAPAPWTIPSHASMFTGQYPTVHQTVQSYSSLPESIPSVVEILRENDYHTVGFCNNPLIGSLDNGLKRGFDRFYNYNATVAEIPQIGDETLFRKTQRVMVEKAARIISPIEAQIGGFLNTPLGLKLMTMPMINSTWSRFYKSKGDTKKSIKDVTDYLDYHTSTRPDEPFFAFVNMMETHLPYFPPRKMIDKWLPYYKKDREARDFIKYYNGQSYRWMAPMVEPFSELEQRVLRDMYDAEIAYQDQELRRVFSFLEKSGQLDNTLVIIAADHGESHGDHDFMGHFFVVYDEVVHVPLAIHYPEMFPAGKRVKETISTRRIFHTILDAAGIEHEAYGETPESLSLARTIEGKPPEHEIVIAEAFSPPNFVNVVKMNNPAAIEPFRLKMMRRAIFEDDKKLMTVGGRPDEFFDTDKDSLEENNLLDNQLGYENDIINMERKLEEFITLSEAHRDGTAAGAELDFSENPELLERLRGLGYIE